VTNFRLALERAPVADSRRPRRRRAPRAERVRLAELAVVAVVVAVAVDGRLAIKEE
jgi:hypothetical protein